MITATAPGKKLLIQGRERRVRALARQIDALGPKQKATLLQAAGILRQVVDSI